MREPAPAISRKAQQTKLAQWLAFALSVLVLAAFYHESTTLAKAGVSADVIALILSDFKWIAAICFGSVLGHLTVFTAGNVKVHQAQSQTKTTTQNQ